MISLTACLSFYVLSHLISEEIRDKSINKWLYHGIEESFQGDFYNRWKLNLTHSRWLSVGKTKGKGTFGKVKQGTHDPTNEKVFI